MRKLILTTALFFTTPAFAETTLLIGAGKAGGGYDAAAQKLATRLIQRNTDAAVVNLAGSEEITLQICQGDIQIGYAQIDAIYAAGKEGCMLKPLGKFGEEVATIWFPPTSDIDELEDFNETHKILIDRIGSGSDLFWNTVVGIETGDDGSNDLWAQAQIVYDDLSMADTLASFGDVDAVIMVRRPGSADQMALLEAGWNQGWLYDKDINDLMFRDKSLYEPIDDYAYSIQSFLVANPTLPAETLNKIKAAQK